MATTFRVTDLIPGTIPTSTIATSDYLTALTGVRPEAYEDNGGHKLILQTGAEKVNGLIQTVHLAFDAHLDLVLSPEDIWLTILQGVALHVRKNPEAARHVFTGHEGKREVIVRREAFVKGRRNDWTSCIREFTTFISEGAQEWSTADFSTSSIVERTASQVMLLDMAQDFFDYRLITRCGIPHITLRGTKEDWTRLRDKTTFLEALGLEDWVDCLRHVLQHFVDAFDDSAPPEVWQSFYKQAGGSGGPYVTGWINTFFPYIYGVDGTYLNISPRGANVGAYPQGVCRTPFIWEYYLSNLPMEFIAGIFGACSVGPQAVRPVIGWAISQPKSKP